MAGFSDFGTRWANKGPVAQPNTDQRDQGFGFLGQTPPSVELFNAMFQSQDDKINWLYSQIAKTMTDGSVTPAATGDAQLSTALNNRFGTTLGSGWWIARPGLIFQWFQAPVSANIVGPNIGDTGTAVLPFPLVWPTIPVSVTLTMVNFANVEGSELSAAVYTWDRFNVGVQVTRVTGGQTPGVVEQAAICCIAIGK